MQRWNGYLPSLITRTTSQEGILSTLVLNDLFWRTLADINWIRVTGILETLAGNAIASITVTTLSDMTGLFHILGLVAQWLLAFYLVVTVTPRVYLRSAETITTDYRFRLSTATVSVGIAFVLSPFFVFATGTDWALAPRYVAVLLLGGCLFWLYFARIYQWNRMGPEARVELLSAFIPVPAADRTELLEWFRAGGMRTQFAVLVWKMALVLICIFPSVLLGFFLQFALALYPLLEVGVLVGVTVDRWAGRSSQRNYFSWLGELESRLYDSVVYATRGIKGMTSMFLVMAGFLIPVLLFAGTFPLWTQQITFWSGMVRSPAPFYFTPITGFIIWNQVGMFTCLFLASGYQLWFWFRMLDRLPYYLDTWERRRAVTNAYQSTSQTREATSGVECYQSDSRPLARPKGLLLPAVLAFAAPMLFLYMDPYGVDEPFPFALHWRFALIWPGVVGILVGSVWLTIIRKAQRIGSDTYAIPLSLTIQGGLISILTSFSRSPIEGAVRVGDVWLAPGSFEVFMLAIPWWIFFFEDVALYARRHSGLRSYISAGYLVCFGMFTAGLAILGSGTTTTMLKILSIACLAGGILLAFGEYVSRETM